MKSIRHPDYTERSEDIIFELETANCNTNS